MYFKTNYYTWRKLFLIFFFFELVIILNCSNAAKVTTTTKPLIAATVDPKTQPGRVKQSFTGNESSWVPGVSAAVIVIIVFLISLFACCIHCPFCIVYKRNADRRLQQMSFRKHEAPIWRTTTELSEV